MKEQTRTYIEIFYPGIVFSGAETRIVKDRNVTDALSALPRGAFAFRFYDQVSRETIVDKKITVAYGDRKNVSGMYYPDGELFTLEQIEAFGEEYEILADNMRINDWPIVVKTRLGNFQAFTKKDHILKEVTPCQPATPKK